MRGLTVKGKVELVLASIFHLREPVRRNIKVSWLKHVKNITNNWEMIH